MATPSIVIPQKEIEGLRADGAIVVSELRAIKVTDQDTCSMATDALQRRKAWEQRVQDRFKPLKDSAYNLHRQICALEREVLDSGKADADATRQNRDGYLLQIERERKALEDAKIKEQREQEERDRKAAGERARDMGASKAAVKQIEKEFVPLPPPVVEAAPLPTGTYSRETWKWRPEVSAEAAVRSIIQAIAGSKDKNYNKMLAGYLKLDEKALQGDATSKKKAASVPGIVFYPDSKIVDKAAK